MKFLPRAGEVACRRHDGGVFSPGDSRALPSPSHRFAAGRSLCSKREGKKAFNFLLPIAQFTEGEM